MASSRQAGRDLLGPPGPGELRFTALGGVGEIGKNLSLLEVSQDVVVIDAGLSFPEEEAPGVDVVLPDISFLRTRRDRLRAVLLTHGHEDHIGALPFYLSELDVPVYGTAMTIGLLRNKLERRGYAGRARLHELEIRQPVQVGELTVELIHMTHSVPGSCGLAIRSRAGLVVHTGDFKLDHSPVGGAGPDLARLAELGLEGVRLLLSDSTNAIFPGLTPSELAVRPALRQALEEAPGRVLVVTFASNLARIRQTLELAHEVGRRCCLVGRSMLRNTDTATQLGYLQLPPGLLATPRELPGIPPERLCLIATGSQGEPLAALSRIAAGSHPFIRVHPQDTVVLAANPIPGNEATVAQIVNRLVEHGVRVLAGSGDGVHASGHGSAEELRFVLDLLRPQSFVPVHGEPRHLAAHARLARLAGLPDGAVAMVENGDVLELGPGRQRISGRVTVGAIPIDADGRTLVASPAPTGAGTGLGTGAMVVVSVTMDRGLSHLSAGPEALVVGAATPEQQRSASLGRARVRRAIRDRHRGFRDVGEVGQVASRAMAAHLAHSGAWRPGVASVVSVL